MDSLPQLPSPAEMWRRFDPNPPLELLDLASSIYGPEAVADAIEAIGSADQLRAYEPCLLTLLKLRHQQATLAESDQ